jgi:alpha-L-fucosidase
MSVSRTCPVLILISALTAIAAGPYQPTTESLRSHKAPQWFEDAKIGIFIHWGPYAVPAYHEWYVEFISPKANFGFMMGGPPYTATRGDLPDEIFREKTLADAVQYHRKNWGADFPYDDFIPMFKA